MLQFRGIHDVSCMHYIVRNEQVKMLDIYRYFSREEWVCQLKKSWAISLICKVHEVNVHGIHSIFLNDQSAIFLHNTWFLYICAYRHKTASSRENKKKQWWQKVRFSSKFFFYLALFKWIKMIDEICKGTLFLIKSNLLFFTTTMNKWFLKSLL